MLSLRLWAAVCLFLSAHPRAIRGDDVDVCTRNHGINSYSNYCNPSSTLCCATRGSLYPQCQQFLNQGWCCVDGHDDQDCYIDQPSVCDTDLAAVHCSRLAPDTEQACCPDFTRCSDSHDATDAFVRCEIRSTDLAAMHSSSTSSASATLRRDSASVSATPSSMSSLSAHADATSNASVSTSYAVTHNKGASSISPGTIAGIAIGCAVVVALRVFSAVLYREQQRRKYAHGDFKHLPPFSQTEPAAAAASASEHKLRSGVELSANTVPLELQGSETIHLSDGQNGGDGHVSGK